LQCLLGRNIFGQIHCDATLPVHANFATIPYHFHIYGMKTTMDLPDDLYRRVKTRAAIQSVPVRDLISEGLRAILAVPEDETVAKDEFRQVLSVLDDILRCPPSQGERTVQLQAEVRRQRHEGRSREETAR
jgi:hypothetical protein